MSDATDRAAEDIANEVPGLSLSDRRRVAHALDNAGRLVTPEHDRQVAAKTWNETIAAVAWATDHGPDPLRYVAENNPYRKADDEGA